MTARARIGVVIVLGAAALMACERARAPVNGIGEFELGKTRLASVQPRSMACHWNESAGVTRCWVDTRQSLAGRVPKVELDFAGQEPESLLTEILMEVPGCELMELSRWFAERLGPPSTESQDTVTWVQKYIAVTAKVTGPSRCKVSAVSPEPPAPG